MGFWKKGEEQKSRVKKTMGLARSDEARSDGCVRMKVLKDELGLNLLELSTTCTVINHSKNSMCESTYLGNLYRPHEDGATSAVYLNKLAFELRKEERKRIH